MHPKSENRIPQPQHLAQRLRVRHQRENVPQREDLDVRDALQQVRVQRGVAVLQAEAEEADARMHAVEVLQDVLPDVLAQQRVEAVVALQLRHHVRKGAQKYVHALDVAEFERGRVKDANEIRLLHLRPKVGAVFERAEGVVADLPIEVARALLRSSSK